MTKQLTELKQEGVPEKSLIKLSKLSQQIDAHYEEILEFNDYLTEILAENIKNANK